MLKVNVNGADYTVNVKFQPADLKPFRETHRTVREQDRREHEGPAHRQLGSEPARLRARTGGEESKPVCAARSADGVTIKGGNITQNAQSTRQEWTVTDTATGTSRIYSLTVTSPVKTAVTEFKPADPAKQDSTVDPENQQDTTLASHGYTDKDGKYVISDKGSYQFPEGGTFAYSQRTANPQQSR